MPHKAYKRGVKADPNVPAKEKKKQGIYHLHAFLIIDKFNIYINSIVKYGIIV